MQNVSSEQELRQLLDEGKITQVEYDELEKAIKTTSPANIESPLSQDDKSKSKRKLGIIAFVLMLSGVILPFVLFLASELWSQLSNSNFSVVLFSSQSTRQRLYVFEYHIQRRH